jgi:hypothetical protein
MTTTWETLLADIRNDLQDTGTNPRWTDAYLYALTKDSVREYSNYFPRRIDRTTLTLTGSSYPLPSGFVSAINVECPLDTYLTLRHAVPGRAYTSTTLSHFYISGGNLYLNGDADGAVLLTYFAVHSIPEDEDDDDFAFSVPDLDIELIRLYVKAQCHAQMRAKQSRLDRFEQGSGRRDDNPLLPETNLEMQEYYQKIASRLAGGAVMLYYTGRS